MIIFIMINVKAATKVFVMIIVIVYDHCQGSHQGVCHDYCYCLQNVYKLVTISFSIDHCIYMMVTV